MWEVLRQVAAERCRDADPAHDFQHVLRVVETVRTIALRENGDVEIVTTAALLHELFNYPKDHPESSRSGDICAEHATLVLHAHGYPADRTERVSACIRDHGFSKGVVPASIEAKILQDGDRLDAIGAIGIARCFATCATMHRPFYQPTDPFCERREPDDKQWGIDHFYRKLLRIPDLLHTATARAIARERVAFMNSYLAQLKLEIEPA